MDKYERLEKVSRYLSIGIGIVLAKFVYDFALKRYELSNVFSASLLIAAVAVAAGVAEYLLELLFDASHFIRRILIGRMFVEGTWIELIKYKGATIGVSRIYLGSSAYDITVSGRNDRNATLAAHAATSDGADRAAAAELAAGQFFAELVQMKWPILRYLYSGNPTDLNPRQDGYGQLQFMERNAGPPVRFSGFFIHGSTGRRYDVDAVRIFDAATLKKLDNLETAADTMISIARNIELKPIKLPGSKIVNDE